MQREEEGKEIKLREMTKGTIENRLFCCVPHESLRNLHAQ